MLILYLVFITISTIYCADFTLLQISNFTCDANVTYIYCEDISYLIPKPYEEDLKYCLRHLMDNVLRFGSCSPSVLPLLGPILFNSINSNGSITFDVSNHGWKSLDSYSFLKYPVPWKLIADHNELETLPDRLFVSAEYFIYLDLSYNRFESIDSIGKADALEALLISHNNIVAIGEKTFKNFNKLKILDVSSNYLTTFEDGTFDSLLNLKNLSIANNLLLSLDFGIFTHLKFLETIDISNNRLVSVDFGVYLPIFRHLKHINMESNIISTVDGLDSSTFPNLSYLSLRNNSFDCVQLQSILSRFNLQQIDLGMDPSKMVKFGIAFRGVACHGPVEDILIF